MCWSVGVSLTAAAIHIFTLYLLIKQKDVLYNGFIAFVSFYLVMELYQAASWVMLYTNDSCSSINTLFTYFGYLLIWLQPLLFALITLTDFLNHSTPDIRGIFIVRNQLISLSIASVLMLVTALLNIALAGEITYDYPNSNFGEITCTTAGPHGHLSWQFAVRTLIHAPNYYSYWSTIVIIIGYMRPHMKYTLGLGWITSLLISLFLVGSGPELPAFWCLLSILVDPFIWLLLLKMRKVQDTL
jgi:hypothetical protein